MAWTIDVIKTANREAGRFFFDGKTMRFFRSRVEKEVFEGPGGVFLVTSEQFVGSDGEAAPREWTVRRFDPETGEVDTVQEAKNLERASALRCARDLSDGIDPGRMRYIRQVNPDEKGVDDWRPIDETRADEAEVETFITTLNRVLLKGANRAEAAVMATQLIKWGRQLHLYAEENCNGTLTSGQVQREDKILKDVETACARWGCRVVIQGDPRGCVLRIALPSGETYGDLGGRGLAVPYHAGWDRP